MEISTTIVATPNGMVTVSARGIESKVFLTLVSNEDHLVRVMELSIKEAIAIQTVLKNLKLPKER